MFRVCHVHIADDVNDAAVGFFREALVLAAVTCLHVEDGDVQTLCSYHTKARIGVTQYQYAIGLGLRKELVRAVDDIAACRAEVITYSIHINLRFRQFQVLEEDAVEVVVVVLASVGKDYIKVFATFVDDGCQADYLGASADNDNQL